MAKGKRAAALFEVIQAAKENQKDPGSLKTPAWWFKRRPASQAPQVDQAVMCEVRTPAPQYPSDIVPVEIVSPPPATPARAVAMRPAQAPMPSSSAGYGTGDMTGAFDDAEDIGAPPPASKMTVDPRRRMFNLQFTYGSAAVAAFGLVVVMLLAFIIGSALTRGPKTAGASISIEELQAGPALPEVLKVDDKTPRRDAAAPENTAPRPRPATAAQNSPQPVNPAPSSGNPQVIGAKRIVGMQYILVQSYPDEEDAQKASDLLTKNGVHCTVEKNIPGWGSSWYCVVSTTGFERIKSNPQYDQFLKAIRDIGAQSGSSSKFKRFDPRPIGWREKGN